MKSILAAMAVFLFTATGAQAADMATAGDITISNAWGRASTSLKRPAGIFMSLESNGGSDKLISASTPIAGRVELHTHLMEDGMMKMRQVPSIDITPGGMTLLKPGSFHVMVFDLKEMMKEGETLPLTLNFEKGGAATVTVHIGKAGAMKSHGQGGMSHEHGGKPMQSEHGGKPMQSEHGGQPMQSEHGGQPMKKMKPAN